MQWNFVIKVFETKLPLLGYLGQCSLFMHKPTKGDFHTPIRIYMAHQLGTSPLGVSPTRLSTCETQYGFDSH